MTYLQIQDSITRTIKADHFHIALARIAFGTVRLWPTVYLKPHEKSAVDKIRLCLFSTAMQDHGFLLHDRRFYLVHDLKGGDPPDLCLRAKLIA